MEDRATVYKRDGRVAWQTVEEKVVAVTPVTQQIHILQESGKAIWDYLAEPRTCRELLEEVCRMYDTTEEQAAGDIAAFLQESVSKGILETVAG